MLIIIWVLIGRHLVYDVFYFLKYKLYTLSNKLSLKLFNKSMCRLYKLYNSIFFIYRIGHLDFRFFSAGVIVEPNIGQ